MNGGKIIGEFVDCRANSPTLHKRIRIEFDADPDFSLKIPAGVAHLFMNLAGVVTRNEPVLRWDPEPDKLFSPIADILNVSANAKDEEFPVVRPHRYVVPLSYHQYIASLHRKWSERVKVYPVRLVIKDKSYYIIPKEYGSNYVSKFTSNLSKNSI
ncbi:dTDP-4-dehydrorhamnose 3,5-epimerase family protein [Sulfuracidifex tepidarius]|uniref:dTDP-4-dehydrorhamnose 3,5-epimerase n=1 Tax=Sulfuracidifex tepidarius TaxID=1294262 RepID=A0A510E638_9CREN|nr:dTDP-4-dehydrorhamnose 3,5-epimerase family protein [Sulfuracidifex tepidarius]BBG28002.1 hypothetical protein IC007_2557 [Sulfuracidifex tepidarius]